jgi:hypothetical protein
MSREYDIIPVDINNLRYNTISVIYLNDISTITFANPIKTMVTSIFNNHKSSYRIEISSVTNTNANTSLEHMFNENHMLCDLTDTNKLKSAINGSYINPACGDIIIINILNRKDQTDKVIKDIIEFNSNSDDDIIPHKNIYTIYFDDNIIDTKYYVYLAANMIINNSDDFDIYNLIESKLLCGHATPVYLKGQLLNVSDYRYLPHYNTLFIMTLKNDPSEQDNAISIFNTDAFQYPTIDILDIHIVAFSNMLIFIPDDYMIQYVKKINNIYRNAIKQYYSKENYLHGVTTDHYNFKIKNVMNKLIENKSVDIPPMAIDPYKKLAINYSSMTDFTFDELRFVDKSMMNIFNNINALDNYKLTILQWSTNYQPEANIPTKYTDQYLSILSRTSWADELSSYNILGLILSIKSPKLAKLGIIMDRIEINIESNNLISSEQITDAQEIYHEQYRHYDDNRSSERAITGNILGSGNSILPLYINNTHWLLAKIQMNYCMGILVNQHPFDYYKKHYEIYAMTLLNYFEKMISDVNELHDKNIIILIQLIITSNIIFKDVFNYKINDKEINDIESVENIQCLLGNTLFTYNPIIKSKSIMLRRHHKTLLLSEICKIVKTIPLATIFAKKISSNAAAKMLNTSECHIYDIFNRDIIDTFLHNLNNIDHGPISKLICWQLTEQLLMDINVTNHLKAVMNNKYGYIADDTIKYFKDNLMTIHTQYHKIMTHKYMILHDDKHAAKKILCMIINIMLKDKMAINRNFINYGGEALDKYYKQLASNYISIINK